jgi:hypothetical protein
MFLRQLATHFRSSTIRPPMSFHEQFHSEGPPKGSSDRGFGLVFAAFCIIVGVIRYWSHDIVSVPWFVAAVVFLIAALIFPRVLAPLNWVWTRLGFILFKVLNPVVLALLYVTCFVPIGLLARAAKKDFLRLRKDVASASYWINRDPPGPPAEGMRNQF